jgi:hypothetical protein
MPRHQRPRTAPVAPAREPTDATTTPAPSPAGLSPEQVDRWAALIADGRDVFPDDLPSPDRDRLLAAVRDALRSRLVRLIARAIAARLHRRLRPDTENPNHA